MKSTFNIPSAAFRPTLNTMEDRLALSGSPIVLTLPTPDISYNAVTRVISVEGSSVGDVVNVSLIDTNSNGQADATDLVRVSMTSSSLGRTNYPVVTMPLAAVSRIEADLNGGDDTFNCDARIFVSVYVDGGYGNDSISGGAGGDLLTGGYGHDTLAGRGGNDVMYGDLAYGTAADPAKEGNDFLDGGSGTNLMFFGGGFDEYVNATNSGTNYWLDFPESEIPK